ncbi:MAG: TetR/AcrR family transcriptional regulator [Solirubrobacterales bacterium]
MQKQSSSEKGFSGALALSVPTDVGEASQRQRIIDAMIASCAEKSYRGTTITDIVGRARISRTTFYKRFEDKRACFDAAVTYCIELMEETARNAHSPGDPPAEAVRKATVAILESMAKRPAVAQLLCADATAVDPQVVERYRSAVLPALARLWKAAGEPRRSQLDPRLAFSRAQLLILNQVVADESDRLPELLPEIAYLAVAPFAGHAAALEQAHLAGGGVPG